MKSIEGHVLLSHGNRSPSSNGVVAVHLKPQDRTTALIAAATVAVSLSPQVVISIFFTSVGYTMGMSSTAPTLFHRLPIPLEAWGPPSATPSPESFVVDKILWASHASLVVMHVGGGVCVLPSGILAFDDPLNDDSSEEEEEAEQQTPCFSRSHVQDVAACSHSPPHEEVLKELIFLSTSTDGLQVHVITHRTQRAAARSSLPTRESNTFSFPDERYHRLAVGMVEGSHLDSGAAVLLVGCSLRSTVSFTVRSLTDLRILHHQEILFGPLQRFVCLSISDAVPAGDDRHIYVAVTGAEECEAAALDQSASPMALLGKDGRQLAVNVSAEPVVSRHCRRLNECYIGPDREEDGKGGDIDTELTERGVEALLSTSLLVAPPSLASHGTAEVISWSTQSLKIVDRMHVPISRAAAGLVTPSQLCVDPRLSVITRERMPSVVRMHLFEKASTRGIFISIPLRQTPSTPSVSRWDQLASDAPAARASWGSNGEVLLGGQHLILTREEELLQVLVVGTLCADSKSSSADEGSASLQQSADSQSATSAVRQALPREFTGISMFSTVLAVEGQQQDQSPIVHSHQPLCAPLPATSQVDSRLLSRQSIAKPGEPAAAPASCVVVPLGPSHHSSSVETAAVRRAWRSFLSDKNANALCDALTAMEDSPSVSPQHKRVIHLLQTWVRTYESAAADTAVLLNMPLFCLGEGIVGLLN